MLRISYDETVNVGERLQRENIKVEPRTDVSSVSEETGIEVCLT